MTAAIVNAWGDPRPADELERAAEERQSEHNLHSSKRAVPCETCGSIHAGEPGQLWEREAERQVGDPETGEISPRLSYALHTSRRTPGPVAGYVRERGERRGVASGMIIAGEVREHTPYRHTGFECGAL